MTDSDPGTNLRVVAWMRDLSPPPDDPRRSVLSRLRELEAAGVVDDVSVRVWGTSVVASGETTGESDRRIRERIAEFRRWTDRTGHSLEPAFTRSERSTIVSEERTEVIRLPILCLAVYDGDRLVGVFPCSADDGTRTVADCLDRLEAGDVPGDPEDGPFDRRTREPEDR